MSINPVAGIQFEGSAQPVEVDTGARRQGVEPSAPNTGTSPNQKTAPSQTVAALAELPQDEVQVQRDSGNNGEIVIRYVDSSGKLILQVPSSEVLDIAQAIDENLAKETKAHAGTQGTAGGGKTHGY